MRSCNAVEIKPESCSERLFRQFTTEPGLRHSQVTPGCRYRNSKSFGRFVYTQSAEVSQFDYASFSSIDSGKLGKSFVQKQEIGSFFFRIDYGFFQRNFS